MPKIEWPGSQEPEQKIQMPKSYRSEDLNKSYRSDHLHTWFAACFIGHYKSLAAYDETEAKTYSFDVIEEGEYMDGAEMFLRETGLTNDTLIEAIMNTVDWDNVIEIFKTSIGYKNLYC